jgi:ribosomal protein L37AE/L43A
MENTKKVSEKKQCDIHVVVDEFCPKCKSTDVSEISDHYTKCGKCKFEYVG